MGSKMYRQGRVKTLRGLKYCNQYSVPMADTYRLMYSFFWIIKRSELNYNINKHEVAYVMFYTFMLYYFFI